MRRFGMTLAIALLAACSDQRERPAQTAGAGAEAPPAMAYRQYVEARAKLTAFDQIYPYVTASRRASLAKMPQDPETLQMFKDIGDIRELRVTSVALNGDTARVAVEAQVPNPMTQERQSAVGTITLYREDGAWKVEKEAWNFPTPVQVPAR